MNLHVLRVPAYDGRHDHEVLLIGTDSILKAAKGECGLVQIDVLVIQIRDVVSLRNRHLIVYLLQLLSFVAKLVVLHFGETRPLCLEVGSKDKHLILSVLETGQVLSLDLLLSPQFDDLPSLLLAFLTLHIEHLDVTDVSLSEVKLILIL